jgi:hypothetical protein
MIESATFKSGCMEPLENASEMIILDAPNFVPMGARLLKGFGKGICIRIGNETI